MESGGQPMKIQVSETTYQNLQTAGGFFLAEKGEIEIKVLSSQRIMNTANLIRAKER